MPRKLLSPADVGPLRPDAIRLARFSPDGECLISLREQAHNGNKCLLLYAGPAEFAALIASTEAQERTAGRLRKLGDGLQEWSR